MHVNLEPNYRVQRRVRCAPRWKGGFGWPTLTLLACAGLTGCQTPHYRSETVLKPDGGLTRAIYQPLTGTPEAVRSPSLWAQTRDVPDPNELNRQGWDGPIPELPRRKPDKGSAYFAAWGPFASLKDVPDCVRFPAPEGSGLPDGKLDRHHERGDLVFVITHEWRETLTDVVRWDDMHKAREEFAELMITLGQDVFNAVKGKEYDGTGLVKWLRGEGKEWLSEMTDHAFVYCASHKGPKTPETLMGQLADICARHGLKLKAGDQFLEGDAFQLALSDFATDLLVRTLRRKKDGQSIDKPEATALFKDIMREGSKDEPAPFQAAARQVVTQKFGDVKAFERLAGKLGARIVGLYFQRFLVADRFDYSLTMPGEVVRTNGDLLSTNQVRWRFDVRAAFPMGYEMACASVDAPARVQQDLLKGRPLANREAALRYVHLVQGREKLVQALRQCREQKAMAPLYEYRTQAGGDEVKRVDQLLKLLKLPPG